MITAAILQTHVDFAQNSRMRDFYSPKQRKVKGLPLFSHLCTIQKQNFPICKISYFRQTTQEEPKPVFLEMTGLPDLMTPITPLPEHVK
ncbi:hypothetical protein D0S45_01830 [Marinifilum sp. JC120]|nr:hypothetical protein D0S45_01830 [Marinifilum sp. JC120]